MRKKNQEITDKKIVEEIISESQICRIAMTDNGRPYLLPFNYGYRDNCIYIHSAPEGKKIDLLKKNNYVCFETEQKAVIIKQDQACNWATVYRSVMGYGTIEIITDSKEKQKGLEIIMAHNGAPDNIYFEKKQVDNIVILKLTIEEISGKQSNNWAKIQAKNDYEITSERLYLKEFSWDDLDNIHKLHQFPEVDEFNTLGIPKDITVTKEVIRPVIEDKANEVRKRIVWAIFEKTTDTFIGEAGISLSADKFKLGEIYYKLMPMHWGKGFGTEIAKALIGFGFERLKLHKVEAGVATENIRSVRVLEKAGMTREGLRRKILPIRGEWKDNYHYAIVESEINTN
jgi:[ribosomal protein S5]-alanine N-acetyltransferase